MELDLRVVLSPTTSNFKFKIRLKSPPDIKLVSSSSFKFDNTYLILRARFPVELPG